MFLIKFIRKHNKLSLVLAIMILIIYGLLQVRTVNVIRNVCFEKVEGFTLIVVAFANFFVFCSGFISVAFITLITNWCYEVGCCLEVDKKELFLSASFGYVIYVFFYIGIYLLLSRIDQQHQIGNIILENINECKEYNIIQVINKAFQLVYYVFLVYIVNYLVEDNTWHDSFKYGILLSVIYIIQIFMLLKG